MKESLGAGPLLSTALLLWGCADESQHRQLDSSLQQPPLVNCTSTRAGDFVQVNCSDGSSCSYQYSGTETNSRCSGGSALGAAPPQPMQATCTSTRMGEVVQVQCSDGSSCTQKFNGAQTYTGCR
jgi:hypothetical protein